ncbi:MAG: N-acetylmuramoyl-L-alanine amidase [Tissierellia bacterium]|nr:N-acetylmuramoyl-L-alanine amidase [Tissierellia bacterium]
MQVHAGSASMRIQLEGKNQNLAPVDVQVNGFTLRSKFRPYIHENRTFVPIRELTELMGANVDWHQETHSVSIAMADREVMLRVDSPVVYVNGQQQTVDWDSIPRLAIYRDQKGESKTMVPLRFLSESLGFQVDWNQAKKVATISNGAVSIVEEKEPAALEQPQETTQAEVQPPKRDPRYDGKFVVVVDAGHGGKDVGAVAIDDTHEADLNLEVAQLLKPLLEARGYVVIMTRSSDTTTGLRSRPELANEVGADVFMSIHFNSAGSEKANGIEVLYASEEDVEHKGPNEYRLAKEVLNELIKATGANNRGIKNRPDLVVLNSTEMDAALVELGFLSNEEDLEQIQSPGYLKLMAQAIDRGIANYKAKFVD